MQFINSLSNYSLTSPIVGYSDANEKRGSGIGSLEWNRSEYQRLCPTVHKKSDPNKVVQFPKHITRKVCMIMVKQCKN